MGLGLTVPIDHMAGQTRSATTPLVVSQSKMVMFTGLPMEVFRLRTGAVGKGALI